MEYEFENICIDCKKRGYSVGFTFKTIRFEGVDLLDMPQKYMDGATIAFDYLNALHVIHSIEKSVQNHEGESEYNTDFALIKLIQSQTRKKFTFFYNILKIENIYSQSANDLNKKTLPLNGLYYLMDVYSESKTHIDIIITIINNTQNPIDNFDLYWFLDFDIGGNVHNKSNIAERIDDFSIVMFNFQEDDNNRIYGGLTTIPSDLTIELGVGNPNDLMPDFPSRKPKFVNPVTPNDYAIGIQFSKPNIPPNGIVVIPISIIAGKGTQDLISNIKVAQEKLGVYYDQHKKIDFNDKRFISDEKYSKINTAINRWCRDA